MNHIKDVMQRLSGVVVSRRASVNEIAKIFSEHLHVPVPATMIRISGNRIIVSCPSALRHVIYLRKSELLLKISERIPGSNYCLE